MKSQAINPLSCLFSENFLWGTLSFYSVLRCNFTWHTKLFHKLRTSFWKPGKPVPCSSVILLNLGEIRKFSGESRNFPSNDFFFKWGMCFSRISVKFILHSALFSGQCWRRFTGARKRRQWQRHISVWGIGERGVMSTAFNSGVKNLLTFLTHFFCGMPIASVPSAQPLPHVQGCVAQSPHWAATVAMAVLLQLINKGGVVINSRKIQGYC